MKRKWSLVKKNCGLHWHVFSASNEEGPFTIHLLHDIVKENPEPFIYSGDEFLRIVGRMASVL